jgi:hypothetical protein
MTRWVGPWVLVPDLSHYSDGTPPEAGTYAISEGDGEVRFAITWAKEGTPFAIYFALPADGSPASSDFPGMDRSWLERGDGWLASFAAYEGQIVARAMRRVSEDGALMSVLQENADRVGGWTRIFQVWRRA